MVEALTFRPARAAEEDWICSALANDIDTLPLSDGTRPTMSVETIRLLVKHGLYGYGLQMFYVADGNGGPVGFVQLASTRDLLPVLLASGIYIFAPMIADVATRSDVLLNAIYVEPRFRGHGIGRFLIERAVRSCRAGQRLCLLYSDGNAAYSLDFYTKLGFAAQGRTGSNENEIYMLVR